MGGLRAQSTERLSASSSLCCVAATSISVALLTSVGLAGGYRRLSIAPCVVIRCLVVVIRCLAPPVARVRRDGVPTSSARERIEWLFGTPSVGVAVAYTPPPYRPAV